MMTSPQEKNIREDNAPSLQSIFEIGLVDISFFYFTLQFYLNEEARV